MNTAIKYIGGITAILTMLAFCGFYIAANEYNSFYEANIDFLSGMYFVSVCFGFFIFGLLLFISNIKYIFLGSVYLLFFLIFFFLFICSFWDWIHGDNIDMNGLYWLIITSSAVWGFYILIRWVIHYFKHC